MSPTKSGFTASGPHGALCYIRAMTFAAAFALLLLEDTQAR
jgi:hypothetical protein